jgi:hypothetical protein
MKQKPTGNKAEKFEQEIYLKQQTHKDKERKNRIADLYKNASLPKSRHSPYKNK